MRLVLGIGLFLSSLAWPVRGTYVGARVGNIALSGVASGASTALGVDVGMRMTKAYDLVAHFQASQSGSYSHWTPGVSGEMRIFRGMADLELSLGAGVGFYAFSGIGDSEFRPGLNAGVTLDYVINRALHIGTMGRFHAIGSDRYGKTATVWMVRLGYYFSFVDDTSMPFAF